MFSPPRTEKEIHRYCSHLLCSNTNHYLKKTVAFVLKVTDALKLELHQTNSQTFCSPYTGVSKTDNLQFIH